MEGRAAWVTLSQSCLRDDVRKIAFHEAAELFMSRFFCLAKARFVDEDMITEANHEIIRTLERIIYDPQKAMKVKK